MAERMRRTTTTAETQISSAAARTQKSHLKLPDGAGTSTASDDSENRSSTPSRTACRTVLANESITPDATAVGADSPCRWKKRMLTAMRARFDGSATFM